MKLIQRPACPEQMQRVNCNLQIGSVIHGLMQLHCFFEAVTTFGKAGEFQANLPCLNHCAISHKRTKLIGNTCRIDLVNMGDSAFGA